MKMSNIQPGNYYSGNFQGYVLLTVDGQGCFRDTVMLTVDDQFHLVSSLVLQN